MPTTSPRIDKPRDLAASDACKAIPVDGSSPLMKATTIVPAPENPGFCQYTFTFPSGNLTVLVGLEEIEYDEVKKARPNWAAVWAAVGYARSLSVKTRMPGADEGWLLSQRITLIEFALDRLPVTS